MHGMRFKVQGDYKNRQHATRFTDTDTGARREALEPYSDLAATESLHWAKIQKNNKVDFS